MSKKEKTSSRTKNDNGEKQKKWKRPLKFILVLILIIFIAALVYSGVILSKDYNMDESALAVDMNSKVYDREGNEISNLYSGENREVVTLNTLPEHLKNAFIYTEDKRFESHFGVDPKGILRAVWIDVKTLSLAEGASTITQQLVKNAFLTNDKTITRKLKEALIAINIERHYSKDQILEMYLNRIYFGHGAYGVQAASELYFNKDASELNIAESAMLASLPKAPNSYSPFRNPEKAGERRTLVLSLLKENNIITATEEEEANKLKLVSNDQPKGKENKFQTYIDYIVDEATEEYNLTEDEVYRGGYHIYTNLDVTTQIAMEETFANDELFQSEDKKDRKVEAGMVSIDPQTGAIVAMVGGREYAVRGLNRATKESYQPGSTIKPLAVYAPAIEGGNWHPYDTIEDKEMTFGDYSPKNYGNKYYGTVTLQTALTKSLNVPAVYLLNEIGVKTGFNFVESTGINLNQVEDRNLSLALGGLTDGTSPLLMTQAYSAFANNGELVEAHAITKIEDHVRKVIGEVRPVTRTIMTPRTSYYLTKMMEKVITDGTGANAAIGRPVAGKTGSTQADIEGVTGNRDAWFVGYTPDLVTAVHIGFDQTDKDHYLSSGGSNIPARMFSMVMKEALKDVAVKEFVRPEGVEPLLPPLQLTAVTDLTAVLNDEMNEVVLSWGSIDAYNRAGYRVYRINDEGSEPILIGESQETSFTDNDISQPEQPSENKEKKEEKEGSITGLIGEIIEETTTENSITYHYYVIAYDLKSGEEAEQSNRASVTISTKTRQEPIPSEDSENPTEEEKTPPVEGEVPSDEEESPSEEEEKPPIEGEDPPDEEETPPVEGEDPKKDKTN
jgi:penicillin-binding protein 2A